MSNRKHSKLDDDSKSAIKRTIGALLERRHKAIAFPMDVSDVSLVELVESTIDPVILAAIHMLEHDPALSGLLGKTREVTLRVSNTSIDIVFTEYRTFLPPHARPHSPYVLTNSHPSYHAIALWIADMECIRQRCLYTESLVRHVVDRCSTAGQIARVWPELVKFLPEQYKDALQTRLRASQMPDGVDMIRVNQEKQDATSLLAMLSLVDRTKPHKVTV